MKLKIKNLSKSFEEKIIFDKFNLEIKDNINCIIGQSGGGKSTLLNIIAGLVKADNGEIIGIDTNKDISYIFQEDRLIPWLTVKENMELFIYDYFNKEEGIRKIREILKLLHIEEIENEYPGRLSGGIRQRVNIARAFLKPSKLILMDEPFKSLDYKIKYLIMRDLKEMLEEKDKIILFVTHDVDEAIFFNGTVYVLGGRPFVIKGIFKDNLEKYKEDIIKLI
ncbi:ATP-binding cassette domain-containing protein [Clostridium isatidis]|uniref:ABC transporter n=1 Tax=Clostridium isatidis TaxID=182773 RepID=A0A343JFP8_9CLOT|nr:ABC transporter ATP-binding protein [Clostridium isatidis]ASW44356.1 ABC transporter [Clostridium isatidis]NLZ34722.1 ABC transporter ATP-binding protein [Clostridiales bacterium]